MRPRRPPGRLAPAPLGRPGWCLRFPVEAAQGPGPPTQAPPGHPGRLPRARPSGRCAGAVSVCGLVRNSRRLVSAAASCWPPARAGCGRARGRGQPPGVPPGAGPGPATVAPRAAGRGRLGCPGGPCGWLRVGQPWHPWSHPFPPRWARSALLPGVWPPALRPQGVHQAPPAGRSRQRVLLFRRALARASPPPPVPLPLRGRGNRVRKVLYHLEKVEFEVVRLLHAP